MKNNRTKMKNNRTKMKNNRTKMKNNRTKMKNTEHFIHCQIPYKNRNFNKQNSHQEILKYVLEAIMTHVLEAIMTHVLEAIMTHVPEAIMTHVLEAIMTPLSIEQTRSNNSLSKLFSVLFRHIFL